MSKILHLINFIMQVAFGERKDKQMRLHYYKFPEGSSRDVMKEYGLNDGVFSLSAKIVKFRDTSKQMEEKLQF